MPSNPLPPGRKCVSSAGSRYSNSARVQWIRISSVCGVDEIERHESAEPLAVFWFDHQVGDRSSDGVDDHAGHVAADSVGATRFGTDREMDRLGHVQPRPFDNCCHTVAPRVEEASSPYGRRTHRRSSIRTRRLMNLPKTALPGSGATLPDAARVARQVQHGHGIPVVSRTTVHLLLRGYRCLDGKQGQ